MRLIPADALQRRQTTKGTAELRPDDPAAWIALSQACQVLVDEDGSINAARRAFELQPDSIDALRQLASALNQTGPGAVEARPLFDRLLALAPQDPTALQNVSSYALLGGDYRRGVELLKALEHHYPGSPSTLARIARAYKLLGEPVAAANYYAQAAARCDGGPEPFPYGVSAASKPLFKALMGDHAGAEKLSLELCQEDGIGIANLTNPHYPDDCEARIVELQKRVAGRDLFIFGFGPSLADIIEHRDKIKSLDFTSMTLSTFPIIENDLLRPIDKRIDLVCITHPTVLRLQSTAIREWFSSVPYSTLIMPLWIREHALATREPGFLLENQKHVFWFDSFTEDLVPSPAEPLHIPAINTLVCALGTGLLARPRRIFLFGFDGQIKGGDSQKQGAIYYNELNENYNTPLRIEPEIRRLAQASLWWDSYRFNEAAPTILRHLALLFDLPMPPIYNVCADSALEPFPRITIERFFQIVTSRSAEL